MREIVAGTIISDEVLWKYFKPERFISTLSEGYIYFASANQFEDPFEGAVAVQQPPQQTDPRYSEMETTEQAFFELKRLTKVSCWHRADYESDAMWKLYAGEHKGVAICTTPDRMRKAFKPYRLKPEYGVEDLWAGPVDYVDLTQVRMKGASMLGRFFFKHRAFEWEREFRLAISLRMAEEFAVSVPPGGIFVGVDLDILIARIVLGSTITGEERDIISDHVAQAGLKDRLELSSLLGRPRYI
ncbi:hypothetical protein OA90_27390 [Labrenzia sp. OB1]|nr:hypothetical protein OA90_27390 [Labrenzia sp. OB1]